MGESSRCWGDTKLHNERYDQQVVEMQLVDKGAAARTRKLAVRLGLQGFQLEPHEGFRPKLIKYFEHFAIWSHNSSPFITTDIHASGIPHYQAA